MHTSLSLSVALSCSSTAAGCFFFSFFCLIVKSKEYPKQQRSSPPPAAALLLILLPLLLLMPGLLLLLLLVSFFLFFFFLFLVYVSFFFFSLLLLVGPVVKRQNLLGIACDRRRAKFRELERRRGRQTWNKARQDTGEERGTQRAPDYELQNGVLEDEKSPHGCFSYVHPYSSIWPKAGNS